MLEIAMKITLKIIKIKKSHRSTFIVLRKKFKVRFLCRMPKNLNGTQKKLENALKFVADTIYYNLLKECNRHCFTIKNVILVKNVKNRITYLNRNL